MKPGDRVRMKPDVGVPSYVDKTRIEDQFYTLIKIRDMSKFSSRLATQFITGLGAHCTLLEHGTGMRRGAWIVQIEVAPWKI